MRGTEMNQFCLRELGPDGQQQVRRQPVLAARLLELTEDDPTSSMRVWLREQDRLSWAVVATLGEEAPVVGWGAPVVGWGALWGPCGQACHADVFIDPTWRREGIARRICAVLAALPPVVAFGMFVSDRPIYRAVFPQAKAVRSDGCRLLMLDALDASMHVDSQASAPVVFLA